MIEDSVYSDTLIRLLRTSHNVEISQKQRKILSFHYKALCTSGLYTQSLLVKIEEFHVLVFEKKKSLASLRF